jgi:hypothetical protein
MFTDLTPEEVRARKITILEQLIYLYKLLLYRMTPQPAPSPAPVETPTQEPHMSKIKEWAKAIEHEEGGKPGDLNMVLNNPGNLKFASLVASWGAKKGKPAQDGGFIAEFQTYEQGFQALCDFLTLACEDKLKAFHANPNAKSAIENPRTLIGFTKVYAHPPDEGYANRVALALNVKVDCDISTLL